MSLALRVTMAVFREGWRPCDARCERWRNCVSGAVGTRADVLRCGLAMLTAGGENRTAS